jgi:hypothetical protein
MAVLRLYYVLKIEAGIIDYLCLQSHLTAGKISAVVLKSRGLITKLI